MGLEICYEERRCSELRNVRFPLIHNKDPDVFQSLKALLSVNHNPVPL